MLDVSHTLAKSDLAFAKIVSVPKPGSAWSQAYNAGKLFAVLSLEKDTINVESLDFLNILGKDTLGKLEEEFFTLDLKDPASIKQALSKTFANIQKGVNYSFAACFFVNDTLYLFTFGKGTVFIRRGSQTAKSRIKQDESLKSIIYSSGFLKNNDLIILATNSLPDIINNEAFSSLADLTPNEIAEALTPKIQEKDDGKTSAIIVRHTEPNVTEKVGELPTVEKPLAPKNYITLLKNYLPLKNIKFNHKNKVIFTVTCIILVIFIASVYFGIKKQENSKVAALFERTYPKAEKKLNEGNSLLGLNKNVARENFLEAKKILEYARPTFSKNPKEEKQILDLLKKVNDALTSSSGINLVKAKPVDQQTSNFLLLQSNNPKAYQFTKDDKNIYFVDGKGVYSVERGKEKINTIIKNADLWREPGGLGVYLGNIYVLDKNQKQILKFQPAEKGYSKTNYLSQNVTPDFSKSTSIAIDGSIYVLLGDGTIEKFTRGKQERFTVSSLDKPFNSPSRIFTDANTTGIYILDNGNSRIVVLNKEGVYQNQYQAEILKTAKDFEVLEKDKKIYVLSQNKAYEIEMK